MSRQGLKEKVKRGMKTAIMGGVAVGVLGIVGCNGLSSKLQVLEYLQLKPHSGQKFLQPGNYDAKLSLENDKRTKLRIEVSVKGKKNNPVLFIPLAKGQTLPTRYGELHVPAEQSGQQFDLHALVDSDITETSERWTTESCTREGRITECQRDQDGVRSCTTQIITLTGSRDIRFFDRITHTQYDISLTSPLDQHLLGTARANDTNSVRIETFRGDCRINQDLDVYIDRGTVYRDRNGGGRGRDDGRDHDRNGERDHDRGGHNDHRDRDGRNRDERSRERDNDGDNPSRDRQPRSVVIE